jgi:hypothetical protein
MKFFFLISTIILLNSCNISSKKIDNTEQLSPYAEEISAVDTTSDNFLSPQNSNTNVHNLNSDLACENQKIIFSFKTKKKHKTVSLITNAKEDYLIYRYGTPEHLEFQYPKIINDSSWKKFFVENYKSQSALLIHIEFKNDNWKYTIFYNEFLKSPKNNKVGIILTSPKGKHIKVDGDIKTIKGDINYFRFSPKVRRIAFK